MGRFREEPTQDTEKESVPGSQWRAIASTFHFIVSSTSYSTARSGRPGSDRTRPSRA
ncbi:hypothetical protein BGZ92_005100, partial [Podila epicladia]